MTIVVGIDGSSQSQSALDWAVRQAEKQGSGVRAVAVWHQPVHFAATPRPFPGRQLQEAAQKAVDQAVSDATKDAPGCEVEASVQRGHPPHVLLNAARNAEMLVLGYRGRGGVAGMLLGSVVLQCVQQATCPVVVIR